MGLKYAVVNILNKVLRPLGARLERLDAPEEWQYRELERRYQEQTKELYGCIAHELFPDLPQKENRLSLLSQLVGTNVSEALWLVRHLHQAMNVPGDVCEFGIAEGATSALMANEIRPTDKRLWLFDSFQGLSRPGDKDELIDDIFGLGSMSSYEGKMSYPVAEVQKRLHAVHFPPERVSIVPGFIEKSIRGPQLPKQVCFAYIDFDFYDPILVALHFLTRVVPVGGCILIDDYGFFSAGAQRAVDEFAAAHAEEFRLTLPPAWCGHFAVLTRLKVDECNKLAAPNGTDVQSSLAVS